MFKNAKIGTKLRISLSISLIGMLIITIVAFAAFEEIKTIESHLVGGVFQELLIASHISSQVNQIARSSFRLLHSQSAADVDAQRTRMENAMLKIAEFESEYQKIIDDPGLPTSDQGHEIWEKVKKAKVGLLQAMTTLYQLLDRTSRGAPFSPDVMEEVTRYRLGEFNTLQTAYLNAVEEITLYNEISAEDMGKDLVKRLQQDEYIVIASFIIIALLSFIVSTIISRIIVSGVSQCTKVAKEIAKGNTDVSVNVNSKDEIGEMTAAMAEMIADIKNMNTDTVYLVGQATEGHINARVDAKKHHGDFEKLIQGVNDLLDAIGIPLNKAMATLDKIAHKDLSVRIDGDFRGEIKDFIYNVNHTADNLEKQMQDLAKMVEQISAAAMQINSASQALAEATSEQAASLEEISASLEEINSITASNADSAKQGLKLADMAVASVDHGNDAMEKMTHAMESILNSSHETSKIIKTIDEMAFQTNLLALNAAVEAAHAGDAGKGFAVVAEEVKNLAMRSAEAAKNTNVLIDESRRNSEMGSQIVEEVMKSFLEMKDQFTKVKSIVNEVAASSDEQAKGVGQISIGVHEMNKATQNNAATAEEASASAAELNTNAQELQEMIDAYKLRKSIDPNHKYTPPAHLYITEKNKSMQLLTKQ